MSSKASEEMMGLLQELALLKQADEGPTVHSIQPQERCLTPCFTLGILPARSIFLPLSGPHPERATHVL